jgi:hypothetical protein
MTGEVSVTAEKHLDVAGRFYSLGDTSRGTPGDGRAWSIVLAFYAAVHWVRGYIRHKAPDAQIASHDDIRRCFDDYPELRKVKVSYDTLKQASHSVRYYGELSYQDGDVDRFFLLARQVRDWAVPKCKAT